MKKTKPKEKDVLTKKLSSVKKMVVEIDNSYEASDLCATEESILGTYEKSKALARLQFLSKYQDALQAPAEEIEELKKLITKYGLSPDADHKATIEKLIEKSMLPSKTVMEQCGPRVLAVSIEDMVPIKKILLHYPAYVLIGDYYLEIPGGRKLLEEVDALTEKEFTGYVEGRFRFNLGNWTERQKQAHTSELSADSESTEDEESSKDLKWIAAFTESATVPDKEDIAVLDDSYFNDSPPDQAD